MPRPERPIEAEHDALFHFAADLRKLRQKAGTPSYRELAHALRETWRHRRGNTLTLAGYQAVGIGKWHNGKLPSDQFDYSHAYPMKYWIDDPRYGRIHVTDADTRDALEFLRQRPRDRPFQLNVAFFNAHAEDAAKEQYLPQDSSASEYRKVTIPPPLDAVTVFCSSSCCICCRRP